MSWRKTLDVMAFTEVPYTHNSQNTQKPTEFVICADIADSAYKEEGCSKLLEVVFKNKPELISQIEQVEAAIDPSGLAFLEVYRLMDNDDRAEYCAGKLSIEELQEFAMSIANRRLRQQRIIPSHYTAKTHCPRCGCVPIFANAPASVLSCPWCPNRVSGRPMPE